MVGETFMSPSLGELRENTQERKRILHTCKSYEQSIQESQNSLNLTTHSGIQKRSFKKALCRYYHSFFNKDSQHLTKLQSKQYFLTKQKTTYYQHLIVTCLLLTHTLEKCMNEVQPTRPLETWRRSSSFLQPIYIKLFWNSQDSNTKTELMEAQVTF